MPAGPPGSRSQPSGTGSRTVTPNPVISRVWYAVGTAGSGVPAVPVVAGVLGPAAGAPVVRGADAAAVTGAAGPGTVCGGGAQPVTSAAAAARSTPRIRTTAHLPPARPPAGGIRLARIMTGPMRSAAGKLRSAPQRCRPVSDPRCLARGDR